MGRKREKGKARKAKAASQAWRSWAMVKPNRCNHGCPVLPAPDHAVSLLMDALWAGSFQDKSAVDVLVGVIYNDQRVWDNATLRKMALDIMVAIGVNCIMYRFAYPLYSAHAISIL